MVPKLEPEVVVRIRLLRQLAGHGSGLEGGELLSISIEVAVDLGENEHSDAACANESPHVVEDALLEPVGRSASARTRRPAVAVAVR